MLFPVFRYWRQDCGRGVDPRIDKIKVKDVADMVLQHSLMEYYYQLGPEEGPEVNKNYVGSCEQTDHRGPGSRYVRRFAGVRLCSASASPMYELAVELSYGSHQGYLQQGASAERMFRARRADDLIFRSLDSLRDDPEFEGQVSQVADVIRRAVYEAEDTIRQRGDS